MDLKEIKTCELIIRQYNYIKEYQKLERSIQLYYEHSKYVELMNGENEESKSNMCKVIELERQSYELYSKMVDIVFVLSNRNNIAGDCNHVYSIAINRVKHYDTKSDLITSTEEIYACPFCGELQKEPDCNQTSYVDHVITNFKYLSENEWRVYDKVIRKEK